MKGEPHNSRKARKSNWIIDESKCLTMEEFKKLRATSKRLKVIGNREKRFTLIRNWFMIDLGLNAGLRVTEMASLKHKHLVIDGTKSTIKVFGKGQKWRSVVISASFKKDCRSYIDHKDRFGFDTNDESFLLNNLKNSRISKRALQKFFEQIIGQLKFSNHYSIHSLRHTYATFLLRASNYNYRFTQIQLGHSSIRSTQVYAGVIEADGRQAVEKLYK